MVFGRYSAYYTVAIDGTELHQLNVPYENGRSIVWTPTNEIIFRGYVESKYDAEIYTVSRDNSDLRAVTNVGGLVNSFSLSPNGNHIVFTRQYSPGRVYAIEADGSNLQEIPLEVFDKHSFRGPQWKGHDKFVFDGGSYGVKNFAREFDGSTWRQVEP